MLINKVIWLLTWLEFQHLCIPVTPWKTSTVLPGFGKLKPIPAPVHTHDTLSWVYPYLCHALAAAQNRHARWSMQKLDHSWKLWWSNDCFSSHNPTHVPTDGGHDFRDSKTMKHTSKKKHTRSPTYKPCGSQSTSRWSSCGTWWHQKCGHERERACQQRRDWGVHGGSRCSTT